MLNSKMLLLVSKLLPLLVLLGEASMESYDVPLEIVDSEPYQSFSTYPIKGNNLEVTDSHVFWPMDRKLYSNFYINMVHEGEKLFGLSQQTFTEQRQQVLFREVGANMAANDHAIFVKTEGNWREDNFTTGVEDLDYEDESITFTDADYRTLQAKVQYLYAWMSVSNHQALLEQQGFNPAQLPFLQQLRYTKNHRKWANNSREK